MDDTTGQAFESTVNYESSMLSAEWVVERPTIRYRTASLADFGGVTFVNCSATIGGKTGPITSFPTSRFIMINRMNRNLVSVSQIEPNGGSFSVTYLSSN